MKSYEQRYAPEPSPQRDIINRVILVFHAIVFLLCFSVTLALTVESARTQIYDRIFRSLDEDEELPDIRLIALIPLFLSIASGLAFGELFLERRRLAAITERLGGSKDEKFSVVNSRLRGERVRFYLGRNPNTMICAIFVNGEHTYPIREKLAAYIESNIRGRGYRLQCGEHLLMVTKPYIISTQLVPEKVLQVFHVLIDAKQAFQLQVSSENSALHLREDGIASRTVKTSHKYKQQVKIRPTYEGIEILIPSIPGMWKKSQCLFWGLLGISGGFGLIRILWSLWNFFDWNSWGALLVGIIWGITSFSCGIIGCVLLAGIFSKEKLIISQTTMTRQHGMSKRKQTYELRHIWNVRFEDFEHKLVTDKSLRKESQKWNLLFDYGKGKDEKGLTIKCCERIDHVEAERLVTILSDILTFHCHAVQRIIFGAHQDPKPDPSTTLQNPDVSTLTTPFFHLKQVIVHSETYDFHQVERFLTYAINHLGQGYLKKNVDIHVYGDAEKLEPNLYNNFRNLCKKIHLYCP